MGTESFSDFLPLSALQHFLFCPRQFALIHIEGQWCENRWTAEGRVLHRQVHQVSTQERSGVRIIRGTSVVSSALGVAGQCDAVEWHASGEVLPVEYKRGRPKSHRADEVQLCAQAIALEEMLRRPTGSIKQGCLYYGALRRRVEVALTAELRKLTAEVARTMHRCFASRATPPMSYDSKRCRSCSLLENCRPDLSGMRGHAQERFVQLLNEDCFG